MEAKKLTYSEWYAKASKEDRALSRLLSAPLNKKKKLPTKKTRG